MDVSSGIFALRANICRRSLEGRWHCHCHWLRTILLPKIHPKFGRLLRSGRVLFRNWGDYRVLGVESGRRGKMGARKRGEDGGWTNPHGETQIEKMTLLVKITAERMRTSGKIPDWYTVPEAISDGYIGLLDAIESYKPERGMKIRTWAIQRIKWAIIRERDALILTRKRYICTDFTDSFWESRLAFEEPN